MSTLIYRFLGNANFMYNIYLVYVLYINLGTYIHIHTYVYGKSINKINLKAIIQFGIVVAFW